jgi:hypothetical protein
LGRGITVFLQLLTRFPGPAGSGSILRKE